MKFNKNEQIADEYIKQFKKLPTDNNGFIDNNALKHFIDVASHESITKDINNGSITFTFKDNSWIYLANYEQNGFCAELQTELFEGVDDCAHDFFKW